MEVEVDEEELKSAGAEFFFFFPWTGDRVSLFGSLKDVASGNDIRFNALDAFSGWKDEGLPPVEVPSAAPWKFRCKPFQLVILDYDCGSDMVELDSGKGKKFQRGAQASIGRIGHCGLMSLRSHEKNQFFSVVLYEDELADNKVSLLTVKVPLAQFFSLLLVDGVLLRLWDTASIVLLMGVHILPFFEKDVGRKHISIFIY
ncbi:hypothetical protein J1N35_043026 [Gossypium stocksii]|uniref:Uncharacterized protein n=1 Tax=Gossypium stocksii TaxID=47602 RepID=A0A9D3U6P4_9ROSI|nr:hypothetical protein J1N35_043026 [Gossypium stocksii]